MKRTQFNFEQIKSQLQAGKTTIEIAKELDVGPGLLRLRLQENHIKPRELRFNHDFFHILDTEEKAYWLGFLYADGNVRYDTNKCQYRIRFGINKRDAEHLNKWHKAIDSFKSIAKYKTRSDLVYSEHNSQRMVQDLINLGCVPNKSLILTFPQNIPQYLVKHFIRGYFDGDGGLSIDKSSSSLGQLTFSIVGTIEFLNSLQKHLGTDNKLQDVCKNGITRQLNIKGNLKVIAILNNLYDGSTIFLDRKRNMFDDFVKTYEIESKKEHFHKPSLGTKQSPELVQKRSIAMKKAMKVKKERLLLEGKKWFDK